MEIGLIAGLASQDFTLIGMGVIIISDGIMVNGIYYPLVQTTAYPTPRPQQQPKKKPQ